MTRILEKSTNMTAFVKTVSSDLPFYGFDGGGRSDSEEVEGGSEGDDGVSGVDCELVSDVAGVKSSSVGSR